jgi:hypothetical protein
VSRYLGIYLNDHYAGSVGAVELAKRGAREHAGDELGRFFGALGEEIEADREVLRTIMGAAGVRPHRHKYALAWAGEKAARFKPNGHLLRGSPLSPLIEMEALSTGISGKEQLWRALQATPGVPDAGHSFADLITRAQDQRARVEAQRLDVVRRTLSR